MPKDEFDFEDPFELNGMAFLSHEDTTNDMAECFTEEFMNTVHRVPRSTGASDARAEAAKDSTSVPMDAAKVCRNEPQPDEQASFTAIESTAPLRIRRYFMS